MQVLSRRFLLYFIHLFLLSLYYNCNHVFISIYSTIKSVCRYVCPVHSTVCINIARSIFIILRWLNRVYQGQYLPSLSINYVAINKDSEKLPPQLY